MSRLENWKARFAASLLTQGLAVTIALQTASALLLLSLFLFVEGRGLERQLELRGESMAQFLTSEVQFALLVGDPQEVARVLGPSTADEDVVFLEVVDAAGRRVCLLQRPGSNRHIPALAADTDLYRAKTTARNDANFVEVRVPVRAPNRSELLEWEPHPGGAILGALRMGISMQKQRAFFRRMLLGGILVILLGLAIMCSAQYWGLRRLLRPLANLVGFTQVVGAGDLRPRAPVESADEVGQLAHAFNVMVERLGETTVSKDYVDNILRSMGEALIVTDRAGVIRRVNPSAAALLKCDESALVGKPAISLVAGGEVPPNAAGLDRTYGTSDGLRIPVLLSSAELRDTSGTIEGHVWLAQDVTELKRVQTELVSARDAAENANRAKSTFLANMSHELRTPLNAIIGYSQMLQEDCTDPAQEGPRSDLAKIERSGQLLLTIINDILDLSKIEAGHEQVRLEPVDLAAVLRDVHTTVAPMARQQGNAIELLCPEEARFAYADLSKLRQSILNLVNNACKFTENGRISVAVSRSSDAQGCWTEVSVSDTGIGISQQHLSKLFQPFSQVDGSATRKYNGTGLGLAISRTFCRMMGGDITVHSEPGHGSCFCIRVPAERPEATGPGGLN